MKILVTGSSGYIGSKVVEALREKDHYVQECDLRIENDYADIELDKGVNVIVHMGAFTNLQISLREPHRYYTNNVAKMLPLLEQARKRSIRVVFASSIASPKNPYGMTKRIGEHAIRQYGLKHTNLRFHNVCGRGGNGVVDLIMNPDTTIFHRWGDAERDYIHVDDVVRVVVMATESRLPKELYEVGTGKNTTLNQLTDLARSIRPGLQVRLEPPRTGDVQNIEHKHPLVLPSEFLLYPTMTDILRSMM